MLPNFIPFQSNPLDALLYALGWRLQNLSQNSDIESFDIKNDMSKDNLNAIDLAHLLSDANHTIAFTSNADGVARTFRFKDGKVSQQQGKAEDADLTVDFKDSMTGVKLLSKGDLRAFMTAIQNEEVNIQGDYGLMLWFAKVAKLAVPEVPDALKPYIEQAKPLLNQAKPYASQAGQIASDVLGKLVGHFKK